MVFEAIGTSFLYSKLAIATRVSRWMMNLCGSDKIANLSPSDLKLSKTHWTFSC
jgi:hypothetical protein